MVVVTSIDSLYNYNKAVRKINAEPTDEEMVASLVAAKEGDIVLHDVEFKTRSGSSRLGFYMDFNLKKNIDSYLIPAVLKGWDCVGLVTGIEGSGKSTATMSFAKYVDPTFPGEPIEGRAQQRKCDRIVFTPTQFMQAIDDAKPGQAIVFDEAVMGFMATDASTEMQKILVKKMVTIRKKRLFIFIVLPSIFLLRMYMAVFRTRYGIHFYSPDGLERGFFKFYSYERKRELYINGKKDFNQAVVQPDFLGRCTNTEGYFFDVEEYEKKKDDAIIELTKEAVKGGSAEQSKVTLRYKCERALLIYELFNQKLASGEIKTMKEFVELITIRFGQGLAKVSMAGISREFEWAKKYHESGGQLMLDGSRNLQAGTPLTDSLIEEIKSI